MKCDRCSRWSVACLSSLLLLIWSATFCPEALAESRRVDFLMNADRTVSFTLLVQQAEEFAREVIVREFRTNPQLTELTVVVIGERNGARAAVVQATVTRSEWESGDRASWVEPLTASQTLLGYVDYTPPNPLAGGAPLPEAVIEEQERALQELPGFRDD